jgi:two-component system alkaline phosphatase synthesis response regulator PhoP
MRILLVDDEPDILEFVSYTLVQAGYEVAAASNGFGAIEAIKINTPDVVLLDMMMPELNGIDTCIAIRKLPEIKQPLIVFLTARSDEMSEVRAFEVGANDYIQKPVKLAVLKARLQALLKPTQDANLLVLEFGELIINKHKWSVTIAGVEIKLPKKEFELLQLLCATPNEVCKREKIMQKVWGDDVLVVDRTLDVHIRKLREKIGIHFIQTIKSVGYMFVYNG